MDWIKVKTRHIVCDFDLITPNTAWAWIQIMGITATLERIPSEAQLRHKIGDDIYDDLCKVLTRNETSIPEILEKVMEDVERYSKKKEKHREYMRASRDISRDISHNTYVEPKIREDKIREDNIYKEHFETLWEQYPNKIGKKQAEKHFYASVKTEEDLEQIKIALKNYKIKITQDKTESKYIQQGKTWFNNWRDWADYRIAGKKSFDDVRREIWGKDVV